MPGQAVPAMTPATPSVNRSASGTATAKSSSRRAVDRVARTAAIASALPVRVPPTPDTSTSASSIGLSSRSATSAVMPYAATGMPPPIGLPTTTRSGSRPQAAVQPPGPAHRVWVSSMTSSTPWRRVTSRTAAR